MKKIVLFDIDFTIFDTKTFKASDHTQYQVYEEVHKILDELKDVVDLGIFSQGEVAFQKKKLAETNISHYFLEDHIHIVEDKDTVLEGILQKYEQKGQLFLIDDRLTVLYLAKKYRPSVMTVWVKRGYFAEKQEPIEGFEPDKTVLDLHDIVSVIKSF